MRMILSLCVLILAAPLLAYASVLSSNEVDVPSVRAALELVADDANKLDDMQRRVLTQILTGKRVVCSCALSVWIIEDVAPNQRLEDVAAARLEQSMRGATVVDPMPPRNLRHAVFVFATVPQTFYVAATPPLAALRTDHPMEIGPMGIGSVGGPGGVIIAATKRWLDEHPLGPEDKPLEVRPGMMVTAGAVAILVLAVVFIRARRWPGA